MKIYQFAVLAVYRDSTTSVVVFLDSLRANEGGFTEQSSSFAVSPAVQAQKVSRSLLIRVIFLRQKR